MTVMLCIDSTGTYYVVFIVLFEESDQTDVRIPTGLFLCKVNWLSYLMLIVLVLQCC